MAKLRIEISFLWNFLNHLKLIVANYKTHHPPRNDIKIGNSIDFEDQNNARTQQNRGICRWPSFQSKFPFYESFKIIIRWSCQIIRSIIHPEMTQKSKIWSPSRIKIMREHTTNSLNLSKSKLRIEISFLWKFWNHHKMILTNY